MARILICHVPKDGSTARELGAALMGRGHFVSFDGEPDAPREDRSARLRQFEAVIVVWTDVSVQSAGLETIAREALPMNLLVPVRPEDLERGRLPLTFRKLNMFAPRDVDGIARLVARLSTAASSRRDMAASAPREEPPRIRVAPPRAAAEPHPAKDAPRQASAARSSEPQTPAPTAHQPAPPVVTSHAEVKARPLSDLPEVEATFAETPISDSSPGSGAPAPPRGAEVGDPFEAQRGSRRPAMTAADLSRAVDDGLLIWRIPDAMWLGEPVSVEIAMSRQALALLSPADSGNDGEPRARFQSIETLSVSLYGHADVFEIERQSERTQFVNGRHVPAGRDPATLGRWAWLVTPQSAGTQELVVRISALLRDRHGVPEPVALPDRRLAIAVDVPEGAGLVPGLIGWHRS